MTASPLTEIGLPIALFIIMIGVGMSLTVADFRREISQPKGILLGLGVQGLALPAVGFAIAALFASGDSNLALGLLLITLCPGGTTSNVIALMAKANLALSICLTFLGSVLAVVIIPPYLNAGMAYFGGLETQLSLDPVNTLVTLSAVVVVPTLIGMALRAKAPRFAESAEPHINRFAAITLIVIIVALSVAEWGKLPAWIEAAALPALALNLAIVLCAFGFAKISGLNFADTMTMVVEMSQKNSALGLMIALTLIGSAEMAIPVAIYGLLMYLPAIVFISIGKSRAGLS